MSSLSASPTAATQATTLPRLFINQLPMLDWLIASSPNNNQSDAFELERLANGSN